MYKVQEQPDKEALIEGYKDVVHPLITLIDGAGNTSHIIKDNGCYVLLTNTTPEYFVINSHWFPIAMQALFNYIFSENLKNINYRR